MKIEGLKELDKELEKLSRSAGRTVLRNTLKKAAQPIADAAQANAPEDEGRLKASITTSRKLNKSQAKAQRAWSAKNGGKDASEIYIGSTDPKAHLIEFGTAPRKNGGKFAGTDHPGTSPKPFMRPAFEAKQGETIDIIKTELQQQIIKANARAARAAAKARRNGG